MGRFLLTIPAFLVAFVGSVSAAEYGDDIRQLSRPEIKEIPILDRPYHRPGHFYGNTVRRRYTRGVSRGYDEGGQPVTRLARIMEERM